MDQEKIGKFIAKLRNEKQMTQQELADKIGVTDRAISKWENGRGMPDLSLIRTLCNELEITINELLSGEKINEKDYQIKFEENVLKTIEYSNKENMKKQIKIILIAIISFIVLCCVMFLTDLNRVKQLKKPIFCIENGYMGSMTRFDGLGYKIGLDINATTGEITYGQMTILGRTITKISYDGKNTTKTDYLYNSKTEYIGNNSKVSQLLERLEIYELGNYTIELKTDKKPYALIIEFNDIRLNEEKVNEKMNMYSKILLALINNADEIHWKINDIEKGIVTVSNIDIDNIKDYGKSSEKLHSLLINVGYYQ